LLPLMLLAPLLLGCDRASQSHEADRCLPGERGFLQASLRGALNEQLDWRGAQLQCEGGARPQGRGLRVSFAGQLGSEGRRLRLVFGLAAQPGAPLLHTLPAHVTAIVENENRVYATLGDDKCTVESLLQEPLPAPTAAASTGRAREYRIAARGFCVSPAATLSGDEHLYIDRFDFAGRVRFEETDLREDSKSPQT
jgi:hypothetical protein